jgi:excisionase family DNA binding protein
MTFDTSTSEDFVTVQELALQWRVTPQHVNNLIKHGRLPAHRIGRRLIVLRAAAKSFLEQNSTARAAA